MIAGPDGAPSASYGELVGGAAPGRAGARRRAGHPGRATGAARPGSLPARPAVGTWSPGAKQFPSDLRLDGMLHGCVLHPPAARRAAAPRRHGRGGRAARRHGRPRRRLHRRARTRPAHGQRGPGRDRRRLDGASRATARPSSSPGSATHPLDGEGRGAPFRHERGDPDGARGGGQSGSQATYSAAYVAHVPLEPRAALARWDGGQLTVWTATSTPFRARQELAAELGLAEASVHVIVPDFGGGFGGKHGSAVALEAARLARAAGRPVKVAVEPGRRVHRRLPAPGRRASTSPPAPTQRGR